MTYRKTYITELRFSCQIDDEKLSEVKRLIQENINIMYHQMEREDIREIHQYKYTVEEF